jgi:large subunit ribosomal protein L5
MTLIKEFYKTTVVPILMAKLNLSNPMSVPKMVKITLNMGLGDCSRNTKDLEKSFKELELIAGQKPVITKARKSVSGFKIRKNFPIGVKIVLRSKRMFEFMERLINIVIPRIRDFRGLKRSSLDGHGNFNLGIKEYIVFPEIQYDTVEVMRGMDIAFTTNATSDAAALALLEELKFPFQPMKK